MDTPLPETHVSDPPYRRSLESLRVAILVSLGLHGLGAFWWSQQPETLAVPASENTVLELTLERSKLSGLTQPADVAEVLIPGPEPIEEPPTVESTKPGHEPDHVVQMQIAESLPESTPEPRSPPLKLDRPANWDKYLEAEEGTMAITALPFNRALRELKTQAQASISRRTLLAQRETAVTGLSDEAFGSLAGLDHEVIKVNGHCVTLRGSEGPGLAPQWWATQCKDPRRNALTLEQLEFDATGRAVAD